MIGTHAERLAIGGGAMEVAAAGDRRRHGARIDPPAALAPSARVPRLRCHCWHARVPLRHHRLVIARDRLERAAAFVAQLHRLSVKSPHSWRRADSVGRDVGLAGAALEQAIRDAEKAGLIERRADDAGLVLLTAEGRAAASQ